MELLWVFIAEGVGCWDNLSMKILGERKACIWVKNQPKTGFFTLRVHIEELLNFERFSFRFLRKICTFFIYIRYLDQDKSSLELKFEKN